ncbi:hypothetical protein BCR35DRAFT_305926, partial [Leucosporidium creatinivorum]
MPSLRRALPTLNSPSSSRAQHRPNESESSTQSSALSFTLSDRGSYASTCYTSCTSDAESDCDDQGHQHDAFELYDYYSEARASQLEQEQQLDDEQEDQFETFGRSGSFQSSLPSSSSSRSSPRASSSNGQPSSDLASLLASLSTSLDKCFCGNDPEEDSIYCSRACAQADALTSLTGGTEATNGGDTDSLRSSSTGTSSSHYRRVEKEEKARARQQQKQKEAAARDRAARTALWHSGQAPSTSTSHTISTRPLPPRTSSRRAPSSSSSTHSTTPSLSSSLSTSTSSRGSASSPTTYEHPTHPHLFIIDAPSSPDRATPSPSRGFRQPLDAEATPRALVGRALNDDDEAYGGVPSPVDGDASKVGLGYLEMMMMGEEFGEEVKDRVSDSFEGVGQKGRELKERVVRGRMGPTHKRGKLSFDDVLNVMS